jgi:ElaB/YqjD/DUF883 family membrane-anchored ribosome-binding protein
MSDTPSASSTTSSSVGKGEGIPSGAGHEPRGFGASRAGDTAKSAVDQASAAFSSGMDAAQDRLQDVQKWATEQHRTASERIRESPITAVCVTFGAGMLFGMLMRRR